jgi:hypothetical protein
MACSLVDRYQPADAIFRLEQLHINGDAFKLATSTAIQCYAQIVHGQFHISTEVSTGGQVRYHTPGTVTFALFVPLCSLGLL